jgi:hypothetical protein
MVNTRSLGNCSTILLRRREGGEGVSNWESAGGCSSFEWELADPSFASRDQKPRSLPSLPCQQNAISVKGGRTWDVGNSVLRMTGSRTSGGEKFRYS